MKQNGKRFRLDVWGWTTIVILLLYALFLLYPLSLLLKMAFSDGAHFTLVNFAKFFSRKYYSITLLNSFKVSIAATVASVVVGVVLGYFMSVFKIRGAKLLRMCIVMATMSAPFVGAYAWIMLLGRNGVITNSLSRLFGITMPDIYGFNGILLVFVTQLFPLVFLYVQGAMSKMDASLLEASENLGCTGFKRFFKVVLPLISPTVLAGALLVFVRAMSDFGTPMLIGEGYRTFTVILYNEFVGEVSQNKGFASAIAIIAILITMVVYFSQNIVAKKQAFSMNALHRIEKKKLHGFSNFIVHFITYVVVGISILPQLYVVYTSFQKTSGQIYVDGYSLQSYQDMFSRLGRSIQNTIVIPAVSLLIVVFLAVLIAYVAVRRRNVLSGAVDVISMIPYVIPGTVIGIASVVFGDILVVVGNNDLFIINGHSELTSSLCKERCEQRLAVSLVLLSLCDLCRKLCSIFISLDLVVIGDTGCGDKVVIYNKLSLKIGENIVQAEVILRDLVLPYIVADGIIVAE